MPLSAIDLLQRLVADHSDEELVDLLQAAAQQWAAGCRTTTITKSIQFATVLDHAGPESMLKLDSAAAYAAAGVPFPFTITLEATPGEHYPIECQLKTKSKRGRHRMRESPPPRTGAPPRVRTAGPGVLP